MINAVSLVFAVLFLLYNEIVVWSKLYNTKINYRHYGFYVALLVMTCFSIFGAVFVNAFIKIIILTIVFMFCNFIAFRRKINETIICTIFTQMLLTVADIICAFIFVILFGDDTNSIKYTYFVTAFGNILVSLIFVIVSRLPIIKKIYSSLVKMTSNINLKGLIYFFVLIVFSINFFMATIYYNLSSTWVILINSLLLFTYSFIVYRSINDRNNNILIKAENDSLMKSLSEYEVMLDRQRVDNHENKNQLLIIKNMVVKNDKSVVDYIDTIIKDKKEDDEILYTKVKKIPSGGLQGIIYQKMLVMKDKNINFSIDVSRDVRKIDLDNFDMNDNYKLCKIIGVLLDNAIEAIDDVVDKYIMISLYVEDEMLIIDISNKFSGVLDLNCIDDEGYTTKENGHGYGLSLVKKLVDESNIFINERKINNDVFKQIIKVKVKNY